MATYNGHKNWDYWNVFLWINNDEGLYNLCRDYVRQCNNKDQAAKAILACLEDYGTVKTPDGARYNQSRIREAIKGMD